MRKSIDLASMSWDAWAHQGIGRKWHRSGLSLSIHVKGVRPIVQKRLYYWWFRNNYFDGGLRFAAWYESRRERPGGIDCARDGGPESVENARGREAICEGIACKCKKESQ